MLLTKAPSTYQILYCMTKHHCWWKVHRLHLHYETLFCARFVRTLLNLSIMLEDVLKQNNSSNNSINYNKYKSIVKLTLKNQLKTKTTLHLVSLFWRWIHSSSFTIRKQVKQQLVLNIKINFSIKVFFKKCDQIRSKVQIWSYLLKKSL